METSLCHTNYTPWVFGFETLCRILFKFHQLVSSKGTKSTSVETPLSWKSPEDQIFLCLDAAVLQAETGKGFTGRLTSEIVYQ